MWSITLTLYTTFIFSFTLIILLNIQLQKIEHCIRQNNALNIYEKYWPDEVVKTSPLLREEEAVKTVDVVRDPKAGEGLPSSPTKSSSKGTTSDYDGATGGGRGLSGAAGGKKASLESIVPGMRRSGGSEDSRLGAGWKSSEDEYGLVQPRRMRSQKSGESSGLTRDGVVKETVESTQEVEKFQGRGITCVNFAPGPSARKVATAYSSSVFQCPAIGVPRTAYIWDISKQELIYIMVCTQLLIFLYEMNHSYIVF